MSIRQLATFLGLAVMLSSAAGLAVGSDKVLAPEAAAAVHVCAKSLHGYGMNVATARELYQANSLDACRSMCGSSSSCIQFAFDVAKRSCELTTNSELVPTIEEKFADAPSVFHCRRPTVSGSTSLRAQKQALCPECEELGKENVTEQLTQSKIFCLGPGKTGTETLKELFARLDIDSCHNNCEGTPDSTLHHMWGQERDTKSPLLMHHQAFMDNGELADIAWLDANFPNARFVMNNRKLYDWILSKYDMTVSNRVNAGCAPQGTKEDCPMGKLTSGEETSMVNNDAAHIARLVQVAATNQAEVMDYIRNNSAVAKRFITMDVCDTAKANDTIKELLWVSRNNLNEFPLDGVGTKLWTNVANTKLANMAYEAGLAIAKMNTRAHDENTTATIEQMLVDFGCTDNRDDLWFTACSESIEKWGGASGASLSFELGSESKEEHCSDDCATYTSAWAKRCIYSECKACGECTSPVKEQETSSDDSADADDTEDEPAAVFKSNMGEAGASDDFVPPEDKADGDIPETPASTSYHDSDLADDKQSMQAGIAAAGQAEEARQKETFDESTKASYSETPRSTADAVAKAEEKVAKREESAKEKGSPAQQHEQQQGGYQQH